MNKKSVKHQSEFREKDILGIALRGTPARPRKPLKELGAAPDVIEAIFYYSLIAIDGRTYNDVHVSHNRSISFLQDRVRRVEDLRDRCQIVERLCQRIEEAGNGLKL